MDMISLPKGEIGKQMRSFIGKSYGTDGGKSHIEIQSLNTVLIVVE